MAEGLDEPHRVVRASEEHAAQQPMPRAISLPWRRHSARSAPSPYSQKFLAVTAALVGIALGAIAIAAVILVNTSNGGPGAAWSSWSPPDSGVAGEREIADQVAPFYRATPSTQLVVVTAQNISGSSSSATGGGSSGGMQLAVRDPTSGVLSAIPGNTAIFNLCGLGPSCAIAGGTPSTARLLLLRREALELALYTLKYIGTVDNVVAILPPGHTTTTGQLTAKPPTPGKTATTSTLNVAVVLERQALQRFLQRPLRDTLPEPIAPTVTQMQSAPEAELVSVITGQGLFQHQLIQAQDGSSVLVLDPLPPQ